MDGLVATCAWDAPGTNSCGCHCLRLYKWLGWFKYWAVGNGMGKAAEFRAVDRTHVLGAVAVELTFPIAAGGGIGKGVVFEQLRFGAVEVAFTFPLGTGSHGSKAGVRRRITRFRQQASRTQSTGNRTAL